MPDRLNNTVVSALKQLQASIADMRPVMAEIGDYVASAIRMRFAEETAPDGTPWEKSKRAKEQGGQTLSDKGTLRRSIDYKEGPDSVMVGTNITYGAYHHFGTAPYVIVARRKPYLVWRSGGKVFRKRSVHHPGLVARPWLGLSDDDQDGVLEIIRDHLEGCCK